MPGVAVRPFKVDGMRLSDSSVFEVRLPVAPADADGATHILGAPRTARPAPASKLSPFERFYVVPAIRRVSPALAEAYARRDAAYERVMNQIESGRSAGGADILLLRPGGSRVSKLERDRQRLVAAAHDGISAIEAMFAAARCLPR